MDKKGKPLMNLKLEAKEEYKKKNYEKAVELYEQLYNDYPEDSDNWDSILYGWSLYYVYIKNIDNEKVEDVVELITNLTKQENKSTKDRACVFTLSVLKIIDYSFKSNNFEQTIYWTDKLNPNFLSNRNFKYTDNTGTKRKHPSDKEKWYVQRSKALYEHGDFGHCKISMDFHK
ncbi:MAG: hypothetical protein LBT10_08295 [Methanobrevibacter sp.]|jgi:hypothetical protein|nr:hypothetical protein [Methanobrevibacter sp.]